MTPERWQRIETLFHEVLAQRPHERAAFLATASCGDEGLQRTVESLLADSKSDDGFLAELVPAVTIQVPAVMTGRWLGGYHLQALLGAGGMGEVYRARDTRLQRDVAIKILPAAFTANADRLARFEREAQMLASLNHPNICAIYGLEDADGVRFLVLELVEGQTLAARIANPPPSRSTELPLGETLTIVRQVAEALEAAHDKGIIHRDLKPANVIVSRNNVVKVLDFGLAKTVGSGSVDLTQPAGASGEGVEGAVLGTAAYMSPEQARGLAVDKRTDIWAFGCVLYELLTGRVAFSGDTASDSIARILEREPDWSALPAATPLPIRRLLSRCLAKDARHRLKDIGDARIEIDARDDAPPGVVPALAPISAERSRAIPRLWAAFALIAAVVLGWEARRPAPIDENPFANATFSRVTNWEGTEEQPEISPDGRFVAFLADKAGELDVWVSQLGTGKFDNLTVDTPPLLTPGNLLRSLGFKGDGSEIWFNPQGNPGQEKVLMPLTGGATRAFLGAGFSAPAWSPDDSSIVYIGSSAPGDPLFIADRTVRTRVRSTCVTERRSRSSGKVCTHTIPSGHRMATRSTSCTGEKRPVRWIYGECSPLVHGWSGSPISTRQ